MTNLPPSTIAQLLFERTPAKTFPALVRELDDALSGRGGVRHISWDNDDIVFVDFSGTRVGLGYVEYPAPGLAACLTVTAGPVPGSFQKGGMAARSYGSLCRRIAACANDRLQADSVIWHQTSEPVTCDLLDGLIEMLAPVSPSAAIGPCVTKWTEEPVEIRSFANAVLPQAAKSNPIIFDMWDAGDPKTTDEVAFQSIPIALPHVADADVALLRQALRPDDGQHSNAQRMTAHAMNATLAILLPPVGAGLLAASYRYGVNLKHSARAMGATGALLGLAHSAAAADFVAFLPI